MRLIEDAELDALRVQVRPEGALEVRQADDVIFISREQTEALFSYLGDNLRGELTPLRSNNNSESL